MKKKQRPEFLRPVYSDLAKRTKKMKIRDSHQQEKAIRRRSYPKKQPK